jgi:methyl-accepting chemotaxis protein
VGKTGQELEQIIASVGTISNHIVEIARGATDQSTTLVEINTGVGQLDQVTQQNVAMVEQTTAASETLSNDAGQLARQLGVFKTKPGAAVQSAARSANVVTMPAVSPRQQERPERQEPAAVAMTGTDPGVARGWDDF